MPDIEHPDITRAIAYGAPYAFEERDDEDEIVIYSPAYRCAACFGTQKPATSTVSRREHREESGR